MNYYLNNSFVRIDAAEYPFLVMLKSVEKASKSGRHAIMTELRSCAIVLDGSRSSGRGSASNVFRAYPAPFQALAIGCVDCYNASNNV